MNAPDYSELEGRIMDALAVAYEFGQVDGAHHKAWVIDQMVRALHGVVDPEIQIGDGHPYAEWVALYEDDGEYTWDTGVAP